jgi:hypothetical protein
MPPVHSLTPLWPHTNPFIFRDFAFHDFVNPVAKFTELQLSKSQYRYPRVNPTALVAWIYGPTPPELRTFQEYSPYLPCSSVRSNSSRDFAVSPQRISTIRSSSENLSSCGPSLLCLLIDSFERSNPSEISTALRLLDKPLHALLAVDFQALPSVENPSTLRTPAATVLQCFTQVHNPEASLSLRTPCMAPVPNCTSMEMRTKYSLLSFQRQPSKHLVDVLLAENSTALLVGTFSQIEKQLKLIPLLFPLRFQTFNKKSFIHSIKSVA